MASETLFSDEKPNLRLAKLDLEERVDDDSETDRPPKRPERRRRGDPGLVGRFTTDAPADVDDSRPRVPPANREPTAFSWPAHTYEVRPWRQTFRGGTREDRMLDRVTVALPPLIAATPVPGLPGDLAALGEAAVAEISALDQTHGQHLDALSTLLLRTESVASSKIEHEEASVDDFARALHGTKANSSAVAMVASASALDLMIRSVEDRALLTLDALTSAHRVLMEHDPTEQEYAGRVRDLQNWIGGSDHSPRNALYVPPPEDRVADYLDDLIAYVNRDDLPVLVQAAIAHAQFESIHPFTDGNGRIGRALINTVLRRRGITRRTVVPLASALVARREDYFRLLDRYRAGDAGAIIAAFSRASTTAARQSRVTATRIAEMPDRWYDVAGSPRRDSATARLLAALPGNPIFTAAEAEERLGSASASVSTAIRRLHDAEVIRPLTTRTRNQVWGATDLLAELDDLGERIAAETRRSSPSASGS